MGAGHIHQADRDRQVDELPLIEHRPNGLVVFIRHAGIGHARHRFGPCKRCAFTFVEEVAYVSQRDRVPLLTSRLLLVEGRVEREDEHAEVPVIHLIAARLIDRSDLLDTLPTTDGQDAESSRADGSPAVRMPPTRDFR